MLGAWGSDWILIFSPSQGRRPGGPPPPEGLQFTDNPGENTNDPIEPAAPAEASGQTMALCVWRSRGRKPWCGAHDESCRISPELLCAAGGSQLSLKWQMISSAVLGKPCHWAVPGSSPPTHGPESRSPDLERVPGGGGWGLGPESQAAKHPVPGESRETPFLFSRDTARLHLGYPGSAAPCTQEEPQTCASAAPPRAADLGLAACGGLGWPPHLA